jgi:VWFA-related protein
MSRNLGVCVQLCSLAVVLFAFALKAQAPAQSSTQPQQDPPEPGVTLSIAAREVLLDVVVTGRNGQPVTGLTPADFTIVEEGESQRLAHIEEHHAMSAEDLGRLKSMPQLPPNTFTNYTPVANTNSLTVILLDALDTRIEDQMELRQELIDYIKHMQPGTPIAIFRVDTQMHLIQGFTADPAVLLDAAKGKRNMPSLQKLLFGTREEYGSLRSDILSMGFRLMGLYLGGFPGRKNLIWITGSIPSTYRNDPLASALGMSFRDDVDVLEAKTGAPIDALTLNRVAVYPIDIRGAQPPPQFQAGNNSRPSPMANLRSIDELASQHLDFDAMAEATGGKAYYDTNGLKQAIGAIVNNGSNYYSLAYATTNKTWNGQFRHIKVSVDRPGVLVQFRHGYYAFDPAQREQRLLADIQKRHAGANNNHPGDTQARAKDEPAPGSAPANSVEPGNRAGDFEASMQLGAIMPAEIVFTANLAVGDKVEKLDKNVPPPADNHLEADFKSKPFRICAVKIHADARALRLNRQADGLRHGSVEFVTVVYDELGNRVNSLISTAVFNLSEDSYRQLLAIGLPAEQEIAVPVKGNYFLRVGVHDVPSDHIGALEIPVDEVHPGVAELSPPKP